MNAEKSAKNQPVIWLVGDSTVADYPENRYPQMGWGQVLHKHCHPGVVIKSQAVGGRKL